MNFIVNMEMLLVCCQLAFTMYYKKNEDAWWAYDMSMMCGVCIIFCALFSLFE